MTSLQALIRCAQDHKLTLCDINGHIGHWIATCRNGAGERPTSEEFFAEWNRQLTERSQQPSNSYEVEE